MKPKKHFIFNANNYKLMWVGLAFIVVGFVLMAGGGSEDPQVYFPRLF